MSEMIKIGDHDVRLNSEQAPIVFFDWITESRVSNGNILCFSLAAASLDGGASSSQMNVVVRLRCSVDGAVLLRDSLSDLISHALEPESSLKPN